MFVKIVVDEEFRKKDSWRREARWLIYETSRIFEDNFGIEFQLQGIESWYSPNTLFSMHDLLKDLRQKNSKKDADIIFGLTSQYHLKNDLLGVASYLNGFVLLRKINSSFIMRQTLVHEFSHLFGAIDLNEKESVMGNGRIVESFDEFSKSIIFVNKNRSFQPGSFPLPQQRFDEALSLYSQRKKLKLNETDLHVLLALIYLEKGEFDAVSEECEQALQVKLDLPEALNLLGISYVKSGQIDKAIDVYEKMSQIHPDITEVHFNLGIAYMKKGKTTHAELEFKKAVSLNPNYAKAYSNLGHLYLSAGKIDEAIKETRKALKLRPDFPEDHYNLGRVYLLKGDLDMAVLEFERAIQFNPDYYKAYSNLASVLSKKGRHEEALRASQKSIAINPDYAYAYFNQGNAYLQMGNIKEAKKSCLLSISLDPFLPESFNLLGIVLMKEGDPQAGIQACLKALELNPDFLEAHLNLGHHYFSLNLFTKAAAFYENVARIDPQYSQVYNNLAVIYYFKENFTLSSQYMRKAEGLGLPVHPDFKKQLGTKLKK